MYEYNIGLEHYRGAPAKIFACALAMYNQQQKDGFLNMYDKADKLQDSGTPEAAQILDRLDSVFKRWEAQKLTDENIESIYQDIEEILQEAGQ